MVHICREWIMIWENVHVTLSMKRVWYKELTTQYVSSHSPFFHIKKALTLSGMAVHHFLSSVVVTKAVVAKSVWVPETQTHDRAQILADLWICTMSKK